MNDNLVSLVLVIAYAPLFLMGLLWMVAIALRLAGKPEFSRWLARRTSVPQPEPNPPPEAARPEEPEN